MKKNSILFFIFCLTFLFPRSNYLQAEKDLLQRPKIEYVEGEVIIKIKDHGFGLKQIEKDYQLNRLREIPEKKVALLKSSSESTADLIAKIKKNNQIDFVQPNYIYHVKTQTSPWGVGVNGVQADTAYTTNGATGNGVVVAVIDTGVKYDHVDLNANMWNAASGFCLVSSVSQACPKHGWDFVSSGDAGDGNNGRDNDPMDYYGHGTHVSGTIAAVDNSIGVVGVAPQAKIMAIRVLDDDGSGNSFDIAAGIDFARENHANIINMSIGGYGYDNLENLAVSAAWDAGITVVAAAGNETETLPSYPAAFQKCIAVGAIQETSTTANPTENMDTRLAYFSNYGFTDVVAPGVNIFSTAFDISRNDDYESWNGTSMASPHVAGVAALIIQKHPTFTPDQIRQTLESTAIDLGLPGRDQYFGSGLVNATAATAELTNKIVLSANFTNDNGSNSPTVYNSVIPADGVSTTPIRVWVSDNSGNLISGITATFSSNKGSLNQNSAIINNGTAEVTLLADNSPGTATILVEVPNYGSASVNVDMANILLVSDSAEWYFGNNFAWYYDTALQQSGQKFIRWNTFWGSGDDNFPTVEYLQKFDLVIWYTGDFFVQNNAQTILANYLTSGGKLFISGPDQLYWIYDSLANPDGDNASDILYGQYLKANYIGDIPSNFSTVTGSNILNGLTMNLNNPGYYRGLKPDKITLNSGSQQIATYASNDPAGILVNNFYRSIYLPFGVESISTKTARQALFTNIFNFYLPISGLVVSDINSTAATVSWNSSSVAENYLVSYGNDIQAENLGQITSITNSFIFSNLLPNTTYYVKIASIFADSSISEYSAIMSFTTAGIIPTGIKAKTQQTKYIKIKWNEPTDIPDSYQISYGTDSTATNYGTTTSNYENKEIYDLISNRAYYFKVQAINNNFATSYSEIKKIRTIPAKVAKTKILQYVGKIRFSWSDVRGSGIQYRIKLMDEQRQKISILKTEKTYKFIKNLTTNNTYYLKVRAKHQHSGLLGKWSKTKKFAIIY